MSRPEHHVHPRASILPLTDAASGGYNPGQMPAAAGRSTNGVAHPAGVSSAPKPINGGDPRAWIRIHLHHGDARDAYRDWPTPATIVSDGAYGVGGFHGDPRTPETLADWYRPHVDAWTKYARPATTLWFWNTEIGWATVHPVLAEFGWEYVETIVWDKGIAHVAGNVNGDTIRRFPVATEVCVFYRRRLEFLAPDGIKPAKEFLAPDGIKPAKEWLRSEWQRAGLALNRANDVCGVRNAATRKYMTQDWLWYSPPPRTHGAPGDVCE